jgi:lysophospholipase L1-like esterase
MMDDKMKTVVCVGDSTTSMEWCHPNWFDWLDFSLRQNDSDGWKTKMINSGVDGGTIPLFVDNFDFLIGRFRPDKVILSLGFNHLEMLGDVDGMLRGLIARIQSTGSEVVLWSTYKTIKEDVNIKLEGVRDVYRDIAQEMSLKWVDMYEEFGKYDLDRLFDYKYQWENKEWNMQPGDVDFLHCNLLGNQIIAEKLAKEIWDMELLDYGDFGTMRKTK